MKWYGRLVRAVWWFISFILCWRVRRRREYPQFWYFATRIKRKHRGLYKAIRLFCELTIGHELSKTEHGYGGGNVIDCNCRWCDKLIQIPIQESIWAEKNADFLGLIDGGNGCCAMEEGGGA